ncbi:helix-turn-helix domain-containing protein [Pseudonocardia lutea]|uniref:Helix-turn-helix domain-containing protein n=1 Tax=Pseudonocardia lutea TaxID=2172015 RepID=A0ABW1IBM2_9PSEU
MPQPSGDPDAVVDRAGLAAQLGRMKEATGLSFRALAGRTQQSGVPLLPFTTVRDYVQGRSLPSAMRLDALLTAFGVPAEDPVRERWRAALRRAAAAPVKPPPGLRPYPGAAPVAGPLPGRADLVAEVLERVRAVRPSGGVVVVAGPSGAGTSSLLRAGVRPALEGAVAVLEPACDPAGLRTLLGEAETVLVDDVHHGVAAAGLRDLLGAVPPGRVVLLGVREDALAALGDSTGDPVRVPGMGAAQLREAVAAPARAAGFPVAEGLAELVLGELEVPPGAPASPPGVLPLLALALAAAWERTAAAGGPEITIAHYRAAGGVYGAVARAAEAAYEVLPPERRALVRPLLLRLVRVPGTAGVADPVRRRIRRFGLTYGLDAGAAAEVDATVEALVAARILVAGEGTLELAHDVVLRAWPRLAGWVREDLARPARGTVTDGARIWHDSGRDEGTLLGGRVLAEAEAFATAEPGELYPLEREFLAASRAREAARTGPARGLRVAVAVLAVLLAVAMAATAYAFTRVPADRTGHGGRSAGEVGVVAAAAAVVAGPEPRVPSP